MEDYNLGFLKFELKRDTREKLGGSFLTYKLHSLSVRWTICFYWRLRKIKCTIKTLINKMVGTSIFKCVGCNFKDRDT